MQTDNDTADRTGHSLRLYVLRAVDAGRVADLYRHAVAALVVNLVVAALTIAVLRDALPPRTLIAWSVGIAAVLVARLGLALRYRRRPGGVEARVWENAYALGAGLTSLLFALLVLQPLALVHEVFVAFVVGGMAIGAIGIQGSSRRSYYAFALPMLLAQAFDFVRLGDPLHLAMGAMAAVFTAALVHVFGDYHRAVRQNIERAIDHERLLAEQRGLLDAATAGIAFVKDGRVVDCNLEFQRILGRTRDELLGQPTRDWFPDEESFERVWRGGLAQLRAGQSYRAEERLARRDGRLVWCDLSSRPIIPGQPEVGQVVVCADIEERKKVEAQLRESSERLDLVIRASQSGLFDWEIATDKRHVSPRFKEILGFHPEAPLGGFDDLRDWLHPEDRDRVMDAIDDALAGGGGFDEEARLRRSDDTWVWVHGRAEVVRDPSGTPLRFIGSILDISDRKHVEARLRESEQHFRHLVETSNDLVWAVDRWGRWTYLSPRATRQIFGCEPEDMIGNPLAESLAPEERQRTHAMLARVLGDGTASHFETVHLTRKQGRVVLSLNATPQRDAAGAIVGVTGTATDITLLKAKEAELSAALAEQELIFESASEGIVFLKNRTVHRANRKFATMLGHAQEALVGQPTVLWYAHPSDWEATWKQVDATLAQGEIYQGELLVKRANGDTFWCEVRGRAVRPEEPDAGSIWVYIDISARKERESRIQHLADHDALTGLLNRRLLEDRLRQAIGLSRRHDKLAAIMLIDLDGFKRINDSFGHLSGDYVLRSVAKRMKACVRETDTVARLGGDEFVVLLTGQKGHEDAALVAEKILASLALPIAAGGRDFRIGASIGISVFPIDGVSPEDLLKHADAAMYRVKEAGKNGYEFYSVRAVQEMGLRKQEGA